MKNDSLDVWWRDTYWKIAERAATVTTTEEKNHHTLICENTTNIDDKKR